MESKRKGYKILEVKSHCNALTEVLCAKGKCCFYKNKVEDDRWDFDE